jgi:hypothetical protein
MEKPIVLLEVEGVKKLSTPEQYRPNITTFAYSYLQDRGWFNDHPQDDQGYTPWYTYPAIEFLRDLLTSEHKVFEYGSGYSTAFYNKHAKECYTVEHDSEWAQKAANLFQGIEISVRKEHSSCHPDAVDSIREFIDLKWLLPNSTSKEHDLMHGLVTNGFIGYASEIFVKPKGYYDIVVIDGMARVLTGFLAAKMVSDTGYIILDNSDRWHYNTLQKHLIEQGFGRIDFWGPGTGNYHAWCTSIFSKNFKIRNKSHERVVNDKFIFT